jgi:hypothetical protein
VASVLQDCWGLGVGLPTQPRLKKNIVTKSEKVIKSPSTETNGQNSLRRPSPTKGCRANDNDDKSLRQHRLMMG